MKKYAAVFLLFVVAACAVMEQVGIPTAQKPAEKILAGYATAEAINRGTTTLLNAKKISSNDAQHVLDSTRGARAGLDIAKTLDPKAANAKIAAQQAILKALQAYIASKEGG